MDFQELLAEEVQDWIIENSHENIHDLALKKSPFPVISMKELVQQIQGRKVASKKFNQLHRKNIIFPPKINLEQTSSAITANYKSKLVSGKSIIDLTGGLGIDCMAFANEFEHVIHVEKSKELQSIAAHNFKDLRLKNIESHHADGIEFLNGYREKIDVIYVDPSRRNKQQQKVFLLEDLQPNILEFTSLFFETANTVLIKLSPLIDIHYLTQVLPQIVEIHVVAIKNEVKEVLVKLTNSPQTSPKITAVNLETTQPTIKFKLEDTINVEPPLSRIQQYLYEPNAAIQKSGGVDLLCENYNLKKLHNNTQLFTSKHLMDEFPGRIFEVLEPIKKPKKELKNKSIMAIHRNFPMKLKDLKKKFKFSLDGTDPILFSQDILNHLIYKMGLIQ